MAICSASAAPLLLRLMHESANIVNVAGHIVRNVLQAGNLDVVDKGVNDLQTKADRVAQQYIVEKLSAKFPKATIIGEEPDGPQEDMAEFLKDLTTGTQFGDILEHKLPEPINSITEDEIVIWVDPLDGTGEFTQGLLEHVTVLVGIVVNGQPVGGVINQPFVNDLKQNRKGRIMWGIPGVGYGGFELKNAPKDKRVITTTRSHSNARVEAALAALRPDEIIRVGGAGHKATLLLDGTANAYVFASPGCKKWDTCAPEAVLKAIGGNLTDMNGNSYKYHKDVQFVNEGGLLATAPGENHEWYVKHIPK